MRLEPIDLSLIHEDKDAFGEGKYQIAGQNSVFRFSEKDLSTHFLFLGGTGSGKTNAIVQIVRALKSAMTSDDVMIIFDTKRDYYKEFYNKSRGDIVISNDSRHFDINSSNQIWNIFEDITADTIDDIDQNAREIARTMFDEMEKTTKEPFFPQAAADIVWATIMALHRENQELSNQDLKKVLGNSKPADLIKLFESHEDLKGLVQYIARDSGQTQGVMAILRRIVSDMFGGVFGMAGAFSIRKFIKQKNAKTLFIEYDQKWGKFLTPVYRVLIDLALKESLSRDDQSRGSVFFVIDEFSLLPNLYHIDDGVNFGRQQGAKFIVGTQNISQILESYGDGRGKSILSNFGTLFAFRLNDSDSRNLVAGRYGKYRVPITLAALPNEPVSQQIIEADVLEPLTISILPVGRSIICKSGIPPRLFQFKPYQTQDAL